MFLDESRIAHQNKVLSEYSKSTPGSLEYSPKLLGNTEDVGGVLYIVKQRYKFKIPKLLNADTRRQVVDRLSTFQKW